MLEIGYRYACLWTCQLIGLVRRIISQKLVLNLFFLVLISAALWAVDNRSQITRSSEASLHAVYERMTGYLQGLYKKVNPDFKPKIKPDAVTQAAAKKQPGDTPAKADGKPLLSLMNVLSVWAAGLLIVWIIKVRRTLVIGQFDDLSGGKAKINSSGFSMLLLLGISNLSDLFSEFEQGRGAIPTVPQALKPLNAAIQTETISQFIEKAVTAETNFSLGPFKIPLGVILGIIGKMVRGPRIAGQIHMVGDTCIVTAELIGSLGARIWKVEAKADAEYQASDIAYDLACRIFSYLALEDTVSWLGLKHYAAALIAYRRSVKTKIRHTLNLKDAEHELLQTVAEDPDFDLAYYNLGVVYTELDLLDAAGVAFDKAITINNRRWSAYYALGRNRYTRGLNIGLDNLDMLPALDRIRVMTEASQHYLKAIDHCERACRLAPSLFIKAQALNLKALCYLRQGDTDIYQAARTARKAYIAAWWALCLYESRRTANTVEQKILHEQTYSFVSLCLWNLSQYVVFDINNQKTAALPRSEDGNPDLPAIANIPVTNTWLQKIVLRKTIKYLIMARMLTPWVADIHRNLGLIYLQYGKYRHAIHALYTCARVDPSSAIPWGYLAFAYSQYNNQRAVFNTFYRVLDNFDPAFPDSLEYSLRGLARLYVANDQLHEFLRQMEAKKARRPSSLGRLLLVFSFLPRFLIVAYRMGGYSWMELGRQSQILKAYMLDRTQAENAHEANRNILQVIANRIDRLFGFDREISKLIDQKDIAELEKKLQEEVTLGFDWECGTIEVALAQYYYQNDDNEKAIEHIDAAIGYFRHLHPDEIQRRGLYSYKSRMQQSNRQYGEALDSAKVGIGKQPIGSYERNALGWAYFNLSDFAEAEKAWLDALYWEPNNPEIHYNLGLAYYYQSLDTHIKDARKELLNKATQYFNDAYELYSPGDSRIRARYLLAKCYFYAAHYTHALIELRALEKLEQYHEVVSLELADSLLSRGDFKEAEYWFVSISEKLAAKLADANGDVNQRIVSLPLSGVQNLGVALCYAHLGIASTLLDRDIQLSIANAEIDKAYTFLENLANKDEQSFWRSRCDIFKSKVEMKQGQPEQAIEKLEAAIAADDDANTYYLLASALEQIIQKATSDQEKTLLIARFRNYCTQAQKKDWNDELKTELEQLQQKLSA